MLILLSLIEMKRVKSEILEYSHSGDSCLLEYGTILYVDGSEEGIQVSNSICDILLVPDLLNIEVEIERTYEVW